MGLGINIIMEVFQGSGYFPSDSEAIIIDKKLKSIFGGRLTRWYLVIPSSPGAFCLNEAIVLFSSAVVI